MENAPEALLALLIGVGLAAACGFRVFVPLLVMSIAAKAGHLELAEGFEWIGSWPAIAALAVATGLEVSAYYIPWLDNLLDSVATPAAIVAGVIVVAACVQDVSPLLKWSLAVIAGGGTAAAVQSVTVVTRAGSTATTGGAANPVVSTVEAASASAFSLVTVLVPVLVGGLFVLVLAAVVWRVWARRRKLRQRPTALATA
jgi:hypothetical protein